MTKTSFARELVGNIGQGEIPVNFIEVLVVFVGDERSAFEQEGSCPFRIVGDATHRPAAHDPTLCFDVWKGLDRFGFGAQNPDIVESQLFAQMLEMPSSQAAWLHPNEFPMGESDGQGEEGETRSGSEVQPLPRSLQVKILGPKKRSKRILDVTCEEVWEIFLADQVLRLACLAGQTAQLLQGCMRGGRNRWLGMFHVEPWLRAKSARVGSKS